MAVDSPNALSRHLRHKAGLAETTVTDGELLDRFAAERDEGAFAELVRRHGPMVLGVCRRVAGNADDADDAFQAVFLVLVRKARGLTELPALGGWLYGVARRAALKARATAVRRRMKEAAAAWPEGIEEAPEQADTLAEIEQELLRLPRRYREPLILCGLCGRPRKDVAAHLGVPEGTLASRLAMGRAMLAERLRRRGVAVPVAVVTIWERSASGVPVALADATMKAATGTVPAAVGRIASEVTRAMFLSQFRTGAFFWAAVALTSATGLVAVAGVGANPSVPAAGASVTPTAASRGDDTPAGIQVKDLWEKVEAVKGFALKDRRVSDMPLIVREFKRKAPEQPNPPAAAKPSVKDAKPAERPAWENEFRKVYGLADGEMMKWIAPPFPDCRLEFIRNTPDLSGRDKMPISMALRVHQKETKGAPGLWGFGGGGEMNIRTMMWHINFPIAEVEADRKFLDTRIGGDLVFRQDVPVEKLVPALERILRDECKIAVKLEFREVEREVVVAKGALKVKPLEGRPKNYIEVFAKEATKGEPSGGGSGDMRRFLSDLGVFVGKRIVSDTLDPNETVDYGMYVRRPLSSDDAIRDAEDHDPKTVLENVAKQTGLTFTTEKRKVRVLFVEKEMP